MSILHRAGVDLSVIRLQVSAMKGMISELRAGVGRVNDEILAAAGVSGSGSAAAAEGGEVAAEAAERFSEIMVAFQEGSTAKLKRLEVWVCNERS